MHAGRAATVLVATCAVLATATAQDAGLREEDTSCWDCHAAWPGVPLTSLFDLVPAARSEGSGPFDLTVQVRDPWLHDMLRIEAVLDLRQAPSLGFFDDRPDQELLAPGVIEMEPDALLGPATGSAPAGNITLLVPDGATQAVLTVEPTDHQLPQDIQVRIYPGQAVAKGEPAFVLDDAGRGGAERWASDGATLPAGPWTVEAVLKAPQQDTTGGAPAEDVEFEARMEVAFGAADEREQVLVRSVDVGPGQTELFTWALTPLGVPGPDEQVRVEVTAHVHYEHLPGDERKEDSANATKAIMMAVVPAEAGVAVLGEAAPHGIVRVATGVTMASLAEVVGYATSFLLVASLVVGGVFGKTSRRGLNRVFGSARRRVAFHNLLGYGLTLAALAHTVMFLVETKYHWTLGLIWGGLGLLALLLLGVTGALQVPIIRRWGHPAWRWGHLGLALASLAFGAAHLLLEGAHFGAVQEAVGWSDPLDRRDL